VHVFKALSTKPNATVSPNATRWYTHIQSYTSEFDNLPGSSKGGEAFVVAAIPPVAAAPAAKGDEEEEEIDLFGDDDEDDAEAERIKADRVAAYNEKKANKPKTVAKVRKALAPSNGPVTTPLITPFFVDDHLSLVCGDARGKTMGR
jgi:elongation factor 1-beta